MSEIKIVEQNSIDFLKSEPDNKYDLIYIDPPFNTGKTQKIHNNKYEDKYTNYKEFIYPYLEQFYRILKPTGGVCSFRLS